MKLKDLASMKLTDFASMEFFWKLLPAVLLVPFITYFLGRLGSNTDRKLEYRTFIDVEEVSAEYKLKNMPNLKSGTKLIIPDEFVELDEKFKSLKKEKGFDPSKLTFHYLKIKPLGKSIITSGTVSLKMKTVNKPDRWDLNVSIPLVEPDEEIFIPVNRIEDIEDLSREFYITDIEVKYRTQSGEAMRYKSVRKSNKSNDLVIINSYGVKKFKLYYRSIDKNEGRHATWIYLNNDKDNGKG